MHGLNIAYTGAGKTIMAGLLYTQEINSVCCIVILIRLGRRNKVCWTGTRMLTNC
jgi:hypothetical protein